MKTTEIDGYEYDENGECVGWDADRPDPPGFVNAPVEKCTDATHIWVDGLSTDAPSLVRSSQFCIRCFKYKVTH